MPRHRRTDAILRSNHSTTAFTRAPKKDFARLVCSQIGNDQRWLSMFNLRQKLRSYASRKYHLFRFPRALKQPMKLSKLRQSHLSRNQQYLYCVYYFDYFFPPTIREHRDYFSQHGRGFGEDAFHAMWFHLFEEFRPKSALEIGVYRGQTITLWKLLSQQFGFNCDIAAVSPFSPAGDK